MSGVVTRFAPSPTGALHPGNVRTALLNWLYARKHGGRFLLRIEDTDAGRSERELARALMDDLRWLGLDWDGEAVFQSGRADEHARALAQLADGSRAYRCFCTETQLALDRKLAAGRGLPPRYAGRCRGLSPQETERRAAAGEPFVWRLAARADEGRVVVPDLLRGEVGFSRRDLDDPVLVRSDGSFTFLLPNAVDDALDGVTHVLRGDDHLTNSAYQVLLLEALGRRPPRYLHHGLLLAPDGGKLSKRGGAASVRALREQGLLPEALAQAIVRLGHPNMPEDAAGLAGLARAFEPGRLSTAPVRWSEEELWRWHARLLHRMSPEALADQLRSLLPAADARFAALVRANLERIEDARRWRRLLEANAPLGDEALAAAREAGAAFFRTALTLWREGADADWKAWTAALGKAAGRKGRALFLPLRAALTGDTAGPEMSAVLGYLGRDGVAARLEHVIGILERG